MNVIPLDIFMLVVLGEVFAMFMAVLIAGFILYERTTKKLMAKSLQDYELAMKPDNGSRPRHFMTDEELAAKHLIDREKMEKDVLRKMEALKREEDAFQFNVQRNG